MKLGEQNAVLLCQYAAFAEVANQALGGGSKEEERQDIAAGAQSAEQAVAMINAALTLG